MVAKLRTATGRIVDFTGCDVLGRLARILHHLAVTYGRPGRNEAQLPLSQPEMATLVGAAESSIHKALRALRESGAVVTGYRRITILDLITSPDRRRGRARRIAGDLAEHVKTQGSHDGPAPA